MEEVEAQADRLEAAGLTLDVEGDVVCCYARQDKHWVTGPDGQRWENYVVLADAGTDLEGRTFAEVDGIERNPDAADFGGGEPRRRAAARPSPRRSARAHDPGRAGARCA